MVKMYYTKFYQNQSIRLGCSASHTYDKHITIINFCCNTMDLKMDKK